MKNTLITIGTILSLTSCSNNSIVSDSEDFLKSKLLDKKTYELIEADVDTTYKSQVLESLSEIDSSTAMFWLGLSKLETDGAKIWSGSSYGLKYFNEHITKARAYVDSSRPYTLKRKQGLELSRKIKGTTQDSIVSFKVKLRFYAVNKLGNKGVGDVIVYTDKQGKPYDISGL
jgi:hypothetical protein